VFLPEPEVQLGPLPDVVVPDLAGWQRTRVPDDFLVEDAPAYITLAPDWCREVLSPRTEANDRGAKMRVYLRERVGHVWLVDPSLRTLEVFQLAGEHYALIDTWQGDVAVCAAPFEAIALSLGVLWKL
jgi:Uma2 family endonuclease